MKIKFIFKKIFLSLGSIFLFYRSYELIVNWEKLQGSNTAEALLFSILANLFILGSFALAGFAWPTYKLLPSKYYEVLFPKQLLKFSELIGVPLFQKFLLLTFWRDKNHRKRYFDGTKTGIRNWIKESKSSEIGHLFPFIILLVLSIWSFFLGFWKIALINFALNIFANFYPVVLQRMHRARIKKIIDRI